MRAVQSMELGGNIGPDNEEWNALPLSTLFEKMLREKPEVALTAIAKFIPQKMLIETTIVDQLDDMSDEAIAHEVERLARSAGPVFAALRAEQPPAH